MRALLMLFLLAGASAAAATEPSMPSPTPPSSLSLPPGGQTTGLWNVQAGDTLYGIARRHGLSLAALLALNPAVNSTQPLMVGRSLIVPALPAAVTAPLSAPAALPLPPQTAGATSTSEPGGIAGVQSLAWVLPVTGVRLTSVFSAQHLGLDLAAPTGTAVVAAAAGVVTESRLDTLTGWGWTIVIDHGNGIRSRYSHNNENLVQAGEGVEAGQVIAQVGSTGNSTGPHLDYRIYVANTPVDPLQVHNLPPTYLAVR